MNFSHEYPSGESLVNCIRSYIVEHPPLDECTITNELEDGSELILRVDCPANVAREAWCNRQALVAYAYSLGGIRAIAYYVDNVHMGRVAATRSNAESLLRSSSNSFFP